MFLSAIASALTPIKYRLQHAILLNVMFIMCQCLLGKLIIAHRRRNLNTSTKELNENTTEFDTFCLFDLAPQVLKMYGTPPESRVLGAITGVGFKLIASGT